jgi:hypothetical protein
MKEPQMTQIFADVCSMKDGVQSGCAAILGGASIPRDLIAPNKIICVNLRNLRMTPLPLFDHI